MGIKQVVKIGGSLFPDYAIELAKQLKNTNSLIILGGGDFANLIRKYDDEIHFSQETTHWTAIDCMDIIAKLVDDKVDSTKLAYSIAAYVSHFLNAKLLIVTNVNGIYTQEPKELGSTFISKIDAKTLLTFQESSIDVMLPFLLLEFGTNCYVVNGKCPEWVLSLIDDNINDYNFDYTQIIGE